MKDMIQVTRPLHKPRCFNPNGFEKTERVGKKLKNIAPNLFISLTIYVKNDCKIQIRILYK